MNFYNEIASIVMKLVFSVISLIITYVFVPWVKQTVIPWLVEKRLYTLVMQFVQAAEKVSQSQYLTGYEKKEYVVKLLKNHGIIITPEVEALIESAVEELDMMIASSVALIAEDTIEDESVYDDDLCDDSLDYEDERCEKNCAECDDKYSDDLK